MNYFEFYSIPISLKPDLAEIKKRYYEFSKAYHPDFHSESSEFTEEEAIQKSAYNNAAYKTLKDFDKRLKYVLELRNVIKPEDKDEIPQDFLMEMMDINERVMELQFAYSEDEHDNINDQVDDFEKSLMDSVGGIFEKSDLTDEDLVVLKSFYYKKKYLSRLKENVDKIKG